MAASNNIFYSHAAAKGLKPKTITRLLDQDYDSEEALARIDDSDLDALGLTRGQRGLLKGWVQEICAQGARTMEDFEEEEGVEEEDEAQETDYDGSEPGTSADMGDIRLPADGEEDPDPVGDQVCGIPDDVDPDKELDEYEEVDIEVCVNNLHMTDQVKKDICEHVQEQGVLGLERLLGDKLMEFMACAVNIAVIGRSGTGKSSLINSMRNLRARDKGAAKVGVTETTLKVAPYIHPVINKIILWDLPGVNTPNFPRETYLEDVEFAKYDAFIIVCTDRITEDDVWLAREAHDSDRMFYFVRTKIDVDVANNERDGGDDEEVLLCEMRGKIGDTLSTAGLPRDRVFLVSSVICDQTKWDFSRFTEHLTHNTPKKNRTAMVLAMVSCSKEIIALKKKELDERIEAVALTAATSHERYDKVVLTEIKLYTERFGITDLDLEKWKVDIHKLEPELQYIKKALDRMLVRLSLERAAAEFLLGGVGLLLEYFGISNIYKKWVKQILQKCEDVKAEADQKTSELKRQAARQTLYVALESCTKLALGVLEARQFIQEPEDTEED